MTARVELEMDSESLGTAVTTDDDSDTVMQSSSSTELAPPERFITRQESERLEYLRSHTEAISGDLRSELAALERRRKYTLDSLAGLVGPRHACVRSADERRAKAERGLRKAARELDEPSSFAFDWAKMTAEVDRAVADCVGRDPETYGVPEIHTSHWMGVSATYVMWRRKAGAALLGRFVEGTRMTVDGFRKMRRLKSREIDRDGWDSAGREYDGAVAVHSICKRCPGLLRAQSITYTGLLNITSSRAHLIFDAWQKLPRHHADRRSFEKLELAP